MARAKTSRRKHTNGAKPATITGRAVIDVTPQTAAYYVNHAEVSNTPHDFNIAFAMLPSRPSKDLQEVMAKTGEIHLDPVMMVIIPATLIPGLIRALSIQKKSYEDVFGPIRDDQPPVDASK